MSLAKAEADIDRGIAADEFALYGERRTKPATPFFRFPGFAANETLLTRMSERGLVVFGADVWAGDWVPMRPSRSYALFCGGSNRSGAVSCCFTIPKAGPRKCSPRFCAS
jgi:peptidoglycan-N-acetylglucosamine deacetylase